MVTIKTREQAVALRAELDAYLAEEEYPGDLTIARTNEVTIVVSSLARNQLRYIDIHGEIRG